MKHALASLWIWLKAWYYYNRSYLALRYRRHYSPLQATMLAVNGLLSSREAILLHDLAKEARGGCIVEIGSFHGRSTIAMAIGSQAGNKAAVYAVDPYLQFVGPLGGTFGPQDKAGLLKNLILTGTAAAVWLLQLPSIQAASSWQEPIALLWIDGDHNYEGVKADFEAWTPWVIPGGVIAFHDSLDPHLGPHKFIKEIITTGTFEQIVVVGKITLIKKVS